MALYRGKLTVLPAGTRRDQGPPGEQILDLSRPGRHALPAWRGTLEVTRGADGAPAALLVSCRLIARQGGERWQAQPRSTPRSLKKQYQAAAIAPMQREGPLVYAGDRLVFVPGLGLDARVRVARRSGTLWLRWRPDDPSPPGR
ncbi:MAG: hypothetical protein LKCHEGNO_01759 [Burkholderiaceae bacterium]|nr:hypothetical protein [Burkholderiaceae bacterium]